MTFCDAQPSLFDTEPARARGPRQSQMTVDSLGRDTSLKYRIAVAVVFCSSRHFVDDVLSNATLTVTYSKPVTDDDITEFLERRYSRRFQRNVVARTRGLMEKAGWFVPVPDVVGRTGRPTHAVVPSQLTVTTVDVGGW